MRVTRTFIDWRRPALAAVVDFACAHFAVGDFVDLSSVIVVTPGGRAGRRFLELLAERTAGRNAAPQLATPGDLPERLYQLKRPLADELTQHFAWVEALRSLPQEQVRCILGDPPADNDLNAWLTLGTVVARVHRELAADLKDFSDVATSAPVSAAGETLRWQALAAAQRHYLSLLDSLELWDQQTARLEAVKRREPKTSCDILLIGLADMNGALRAMLDQVADRVHVFVHAPEELAFRFDAFGVLKPEAWEHMPIPLRDDWLDFVDLPGEQAGVVAEFVAEQAEAGAAVEDVVVGLADPSLASVVRVALDERGVASRWIGERVAGQTSFVRLLGALADRLDNDATATTCALLRHPDISRWLERAGFPATWLEAVDRAVIDHAPRRLGGGQGDDDELAISRAIAAYIDALLKPLWRQTRPLGEWAAPVTAVLAAILGDRELRDHDEDRGERQAIEFFRDALHAQSGIPETLAPGATASTAIRLAIEQISGELITPQFAADAVEMIGWLELPLDDAPALVVCGVNDGQVPSSLNHDMFLPNGLREHLGLEDNRRRFARDAYALSVLVHSKASLRLVAGRHDREGNPLLPSRLLFATDEQTMARRVLNAFQPSGRDAGDRNAPERPTGFPIPRARTLAPVARVNVTAFRDYIACRYRFYLKHIEKLRGIEELAGELTASTFGTLIHTALLRWAQSPAVEATDPLELRSALHRAFDQAAEALFDEEPLPAVRLQLEQARLRLNAFAEWQALHRRQGWRVWRKEIDASHELKLEKGRTLRVFGRIDRIDYHEASDRWLIIDYKTGDAGNTPEQVHVRDGKWVDLQLPLYRLLARNLNVRGEPGLAYLTLGKQPPKEPEELLRQAAWTLDELAAADGVITQIANQIADGSFWPPSSEPPRFDDFACILQEGVFGRGAWDDK